MTAERWELIKSVFELALTVDRSERAAFLDQHCGPDDELRREVASLLESLDGSGEFLEKPLMSVRDVVGVPPAPAPKMIGQRIGAWELVREIGRGGMGAVFLAVRAGNEFQKRVAIKLIRGGMETDFLIRRFRKERQILARLEHPNIARLIDGGATSDGLPYFVMEYVEGEPLDDYCESRSLPLPDRLEILLKACSAVHYAHRRMIIHRDLKPGNILVKDDGAPTLLDFGIAKLLDPDTPDSFAETTMGTFRILTPAYASPEQMRGEPATVQSDIYALGIVLFELIAGQRPSAVPGGDPLALPDSRFPDSVRGLAQQLCAVVHKAIQPDPNERYDSVEEFTADIQRCLSGNKIPDYANAPTSAFETVSAPSPGSLAVLPFRLLGAHSTTDGYLGLGITDALITKLGNVGRISVRSTSSVVKYAGITDAPAAGRELGVEFVVEGRIQKLSNRIRLTVQLVHVENDVPVWAASFDEQLEDLLKVEDSISAQVAQALVPQLTGEEREQLARPGTASAKAHQAYLRGRFHWSQGTDNSLAQALVSFMQAIADDPEYARAHAGVADYYVQLGIRGGMPPSESFAAAKDAAQTALRLDGALAEAHASLGFATWANDRDYATAAHHFQLAIALNPDYAPAHHWLGLLNSARGRHDMAIACLTQARKLDQSRTIYAADLALCYSNARRFGQAVEVCEKAIQSLGEAPELLSTLALNHRFAGSFDKAAEVARRSAAHADGNMFAAVVDAGVEAVRGDRSSARTLLGELTERGHTAYVSGYLLAQIHLALGNRGRALAELERSWKDRDWWVLWLAVAPVWDELRKDPRFVRLVEAQLGGPIPAETTQPLAAPPPRRKKRVWWAATAAAILVATGILLTPRALAPRPAPFERTALLKLTTDGIALRAAISPDGQLVAYAVSEEGRPVVWVRELNGGAAYRIAGPFSGELRSLDFIRDGRYVSFLVIPANAPGAGVLYLAPVRGGVPEKLMEGVPGPASVSPDGSRIAFFRQDSEQAMDNLIVRGTGGGAERVVASRRHPGRFSWNSAPVWSGDGRRLACAVEGSDPAGFSAGLTLVDLDGTVRPVTSPRWQWVGHVTWMKDGAGLLVIGQEHDSPVQQIWYIPLGRGAAERVSNDLNDYRSLSVVGDGSAMVSVQVQTLTNVYIRRKNDRGHGLQVTPEGGRYFDLAWVPGNRLAYASDTTGAADLWMMNSDGSHQERLTRGEGRNYAPAVSPAGRQLAFHTNRDGNWNIWVMDLESRKTMPLTRGTLDSNWPRFSADGSQVFFHHTGLNAMFDIWKAPVGGGAAVQVIHGLSRRPALASDGRIASWYSREVANPKWTIAVFAPQGGEPLRTFDVPDTVTPDTPLRWTPEGDGIGFVNNRNGIGNLWVQPVDGGPARPLTTFAWGQIFSFDWSRDGRLVYSRGMSTSDVVLIRDTARNSGSGWMSVI